MTRTVVYYIHGAGASPLSFSYMKTAFPEHDVEDISYKRDVVPLVADLTAKSKQENRRVVVVSHSLGGVIAVAASIGGACFDKIVTLSSPFGGCEFASIMRFMCFDSLYDDIHPNSRLMTAVAKKPLRTPTLSIVTASGTSPLFMEANDGVVTVKSQMALKGPTYETVTLNHFEVLLSPDVTNRVKEYIFI